MTRNHQFTHRCGCGAILRELEPCPRCTARARAAIVSARELEPMYLRGVAGVPATDPERCGCDHCRSTRGLPG